MRLYTVTTSRAAPYDRTPITRVNTYVAGAQAPHATTQRWTYTVPAGKKFTNGVGQASAQRNAVAAPAGPALAFHRITPNGGALTSANSALLDATNLVGGIASAPLSNLLLCSLDQIEGATSDTSTGGTCGYVVQLTGVEFDA